MDRTALLDTVEAAILANHARESTCTMLDGRVIPVAPEPDCVRVLAEEIVEAIVLASRGRGSPLGKTMTADEVLVRIRRLGGVPARPGPRRMRQPARPPRQGWERWITTG
jgi:hypothetical protein